MPCGSPRRAGAGACASIRGRPPTRSGASARATARAALRPPVVVSTSTRGGASELGSLVQELDAGRDQVPAARPRGHAERLEHRGRSCHEGVGEAEPALAPARRPERRGHRGVERRDAQRTALPRPPVRRDREPRLVHVDDVELAVSGQQARSCRRSRRHRDRGASLQRQRTAERQGQRLARRAGERVLVAGRQCGEPSPAVSQTGPIAGRRRDDDLVALRREPGRDCPDVVLDHAGLVRVEGGDVRDPHVERSGSCGLRGGSRLRGGTRVAADEVLDLVARLVVRVLDGRRLHEVGGGPLERARRGRCRGRASSGGRRRSRCRPSSASPRPRASARRSGARRRSCGPRGGCTPTCGRSATATWSDGPMWTLSAPRS